MTRFVRLALAAIGALLVLGAPAAAVAAVPVAAPVGGSATGGAVTGSFATSAAAALSHWTPARRRAAEPLEEPTLPGSSEQPDAASGEAQAAPSYVPATSPDEQASGLQRGALATTAAVQGVDTGASTAFPNSANGVLVGEYVTPFGSEKYQCSGSVVSSGAGDVVLTAGHCVIDPTTGVVTRYLVFVPGYREGSQPYGQWAATEYATTEQWQATAGTSDPDEAGDVAMLRLAGNGSGASVQSTVGALGIAFNQARNQVYTQYGYPAEKPYDGEVLYSHTAPYAGADSAFSPPTMRIASDFTAGSSGGPWTVSSGGAPVALSVTDYGYQSQPGYLYGPYFGSLAQHVYEAIAAGAPQPAPSAQQATPTTAPPAPAPVWLRLLGVTRDPAAGTATLRVAVSGAGALRLSGGRVWAGTRRATGASSLTLTVRAKGSAASRLREAGSIAVGLRLAFTGAGETATLSRPLRLTRSRSGSS